MSVFLKAGYEAVAPAIIQPAGVFLDVVGEDAARAHLRVHRSRRRRAVHAPRPHGADLPPAPRAPLGRQTSPAKYCYNGAAFRFQPQGADSAHPREFRQTGIEAFGDADREQRRSRDRGARRRGARGRGPRRYMRCASATLACFAPF